MRLDIKFHRAANNEFIEASTWYEEKRAGLGAEFIAEIECCLTVMADYPTRYAVVYKEVRQIAVNKFPYGLYFRVEAKRIVVLAVFHSRRNPSIWQTRAS
jgi:plasmid stabilization system protein ParE